MNEDFLLPASHVRGSKDRIADRRFHKNRQPLKFYCIDGERRGEREREREREREKKEKAKEEKN
jgi:hypothetical protein